MVPSMPTVVAPAWADDDGAHDEHREHAAMTSETLEEAHEVLANMLLVLVALHVGGVILASFRHHENLARAMLTGDKRAPGSGDIA
jgi:cytochrome b